MHSKTDQDQLPFPGTLSLQHRSKLAGAQARLWWCCKAGAQAASYIARCGIFFVTAQDDSWSANGCPVWDFSVTAQIHGMTGCAMGSLFSFIDWNAVLEYWKHIINVKV